MEAAVTELETHTHPGPAVYIKIAFVLFLVTALEVAAYELSHRGGTSEAVQKWRADLLTPENSRSPRPTCRRASGSPRSFSRAGPRY